MNINDQFNALMKTEEVLAKTKKEKAKKDKKVRRDMSKNEKIIKLDRR